MDDIQKAKIKLAQTQSAADIEQKKIEDLSIKNEEISKVISDKEAKIISLDKQIADKLQEIAENDNKVNEIKARTNESISALADISSLIISKTDVLKELEESITSTKENYQIEIVKLDSSYQDKKDFLDQEIKETIKAKEELLSANKIIADENIKLKLEGDELNNLIIGKRKEKEILEKEIADLEKKSLDLDISNNKIREDNSNLESINSILKEDIEKNKIEKENTTIELEKEKKELDSMKAYRIKLMQKGKDINIALDDIARIYKEANIQLPIEIEKIKI